MQLKMLSENKLFVRICKDYWQLNKDGRYAFKVRDIAVMYDMKPREISKLVEQHSYVFADAYSCKNCMRPYRYKTRSHYHERYLHKETICQRCANAEREAIAEKKTDILMQLREPIASEGLEFSKLELKSQIYLLATIQALGDEQLNSIEPVGRYPAATLTPEPIYDRQVLKYLFDRNLLLISESTSQKAIELCEDDNFDINYSMTAFELLWSPQQIAELTSDFYRAENIQNIRRKQNFFELCKEVQVSECTGFLETLLQAHQLHLSLGVKTQQSLSWCLEKLSVAQVYSLIENAVRDAAAYYMRSYTSKKFAAKSAVDGISKSLEQALANGSKINPSSRYSKLPQSSLSRIVFNTVLGTDDGGFHKTLYELFTQENSIPVQLNLECSKA